jgi:ribosomal protein L7Ae-like RNA K-turn-binding protein
VCGINSPEKELEKGKNQNCRVYDVSNNKYVHFISLPCMQRSVPYSYAYRLALLSAIGTLRSQDLEDYQVSVFVALY